MFAFAIGIICLVALIGTVVHHRQGYASPWGAHHRSWRGWVPPGPHRDPWRRPRNGEREILEGLLATIDATPEQEEIIREQVRQLRKKVRSMRGEAERTRGDVARAVRAESFDENIMGELFVRHDDELRELRIQSVELLATVHAALDERQRELLADFITSGHPFHFGGPYRAAW